VEEPDWQTFTVSPLGGEPSLLLSNAAGLTWLDQRRVLFSEIRTGAHMGIVTAMERIHGPDDRGAFPGSRLVGGWAISPGPDPSVFAYTKTVVHRNLFRISLRDQ
jgi:hypothetical protein